MRAGAERELRRIGLAAAAEIDTGRRRTCARRRITGSGLRDTRVTSEEAPDFRMRKRRRDVEQEAAERSLRRRFDPVELGRIGHVVDRVEVRCRRVDDRNLEVRVVVVINAQLRAQVAVHQRALPAQFVIDDFFRLERARRDAEQVDAVQAAGLRALCDEGVDEMVGVDRPVDRGLAIDRLVRGEIMLGERGRHDDQRRRRSQIDTRDIGDRIGGVVARGRARPAPAKRDLDCVGQLVADLPEHRGCRVRVGADDFQRPDDARRRQRTITAIWHEIIMVALQEAAEQPGEPAGVRRDDVDFLRPDFLAREILERVGPGACRVDVDRLLGRAVLIARDRADHEAAVEGIADVQRDAAELVLSGQRRIAGDVERIRRVERRRCGGAEIGGRRREAAVVDLVVVAFDQDAQIRIRLPQQAGAAADRIQVARVARPWARHVEEGIALFGVTSEADRQRVAERQVDRSRRLDVVVIAVLRGREPLDPVERRVDRGDEHRAAGRIAAGKCALRSAQQFDRGDVVIGLGLEIARETRNTVAIGDDTHADRAGDLGLADAADVEAVRLARRVDGHRWRRELKLFDAEHALAAQIVTGQHACGDGRALKAGRTAFGGDDDIVCGFGGTGLNGRALRMGSACTHDRNERCRQQEIESHISSPIRAHFSGASRGQLAPNSSRCQHSFNRV